MACQYFWSQGALRNFFSRSIQARSTSVSRPLPNYCCITVRKLSSPCSMTRIKSRQISKFGLFPFYRPNCNPFLSRRINKTLLLATREFGKSGKVGATGSLSEKHRTTAMYVISIVILVCGGSYAAVPLYRLYCQASGYGGTVRVKDVGEEIAQMEKQKQRPLTVKFNADKSAQMQWIFKPRQPEIKIFPGETALAFFTASNPTDKPITGVSTYNVIPFEAGQYFNKIQCFCFEEQRLNPGEEVDMPVFFYVDPEFVDDPNLRKVTELTLSYTFFEAKDGSWPDLGLPPQPIRHGSFGK